MSGRVACTTSRTNARGRGEASKARRASRSSRRCVSRMGLPCSWTAAGSIHRMRSTSITRAIASPIPPRSRESRWWRSEERRVGKECIYQCDWSSDVCSSDLVLVDRGWVYSPDAFHVDHPRYREPDTTAVTGIAMVAPRGRGDVSPGGFLPFVIQVTGPDPAAGLPRRWPPPVLDDGPHLSYAIQWFSFAVIALVGTEIGRAYVRTPVTLIYLVCRLL